MNEDLSRLHGPVSGLFPRPATAPEWEAYRLSDEQVRFYREHGYLAGIRMLNEEQIEVLRRELAELSDPAHPGHELFYEFNANESADPDRVLFHALGAWRITPGLHDQLWNPAFVVAAAQLLANDHVPVGINAVHLENVLRKIPADSANLHVDGPLV